MCCWWSDATRWAGLWGDGLVKYEIALISFQPSSLEHSVTPELSSRFDWAAVHSAPVGAYSVLCPSNIWTQWITPLSVQPRPCVECVKYETVPPQTQWEAFSFGIEWVRVKMSAVTSEQTCNPRLEQTLQWTLWITPSSLQEFLGIQRSVKG